MCMCLFSVILYSRLQFHDIQLYLLRILTKVCPISYFSHPKRDICRCSNKCQRRIWEKWVTTVLQVLLHVNYHSVKYWWSHSAVTNCMAIVDKERCEEESWHDHTCKFTATGTCNTFYFIISYYLVICCGDNTGVDSNSSWEQDGEAAQERSGWWYCSAQH